MEGIRRLFQRRASSSSSSDHHDHNNVNANNSLVLVRDLRAQLASIPNTLHPDSDSDFDFDFSTLKPIKVPSQIPFRPSSMDHHKKVLLFLFFSSPHLRFAFFNAICFYYLFVLFFRLFATAQVSFFSTPTSLSFSVIILSFTGSIWFYPCFSLSKTRRQSIT